MKIKVISMDIYNTVLCSEDPENCMPSRQGFIEFARICLLNHIKLVTSSDNNILLTKIDLEESGVPMEIFSHHFGMVKNQPKDFQPIIEYFQIMPKELLVIGDRQDLDINPAIELGCRGILVPPYDSVLDNFDFMSLLHLIT